MNSSATHPGLTFEEVDVRQAKFYWITAVFAAANILLPFLLHQLPMGGRMFLPIYFFTLIAGYRFGWKVGATTAIISAVLSFYLTGMPPLPVLSFVIFKGFLLGISAGIVAKMSNLPVLLNLSIVVILYQFGGSIFEWIILRDMTMVLSDITVGYVGLFIQVLGGTLVLNLIDPIWRKKA